MSTKNLTLIGILAFILLLGGCGCNGYNSLVKLDEGVGNAWAKVQDEYQRRSALIPNLVTALKAEANFEKSTLTDVIAARASATQIKIDPKDLTQEKLQQFQQAQGQFSQALGRLMMVSEKYPELKTNESFKEFRKQLEGTENRIKIKRDDFNDAVKEYNISTRTFPNNIFASMFGFKKKEGFSAAQGTEKDPVINM